MDMGGQNRQITPSLATPTTEGAVDPGLVQVEKPSTPPALPQPPLRAPPVRGWACVLNSSHACSRRSLCANVYFTVYALNTFMLYIIYIYVPRHRDTTVSKMDKSLS